LKNYIKEYGNSNTKYQFKTSDGFGLDKWWKRIKTMKKIGNLPQDKIDRLEKIGVDWGNSK
jgi:hypothetical protein